MTPRRRIPRAARAAVAALALLAAWLPQPVGGSHAGTAVGQAQSSSGNPVAALFGYVASSVTRTIEGCGELWSNHGRCNDIRKKMSLHRDLVKAEWEEQAPLTAPQREQLKKLQGGITYEEYVFLQKGKEDRGKVLNLLFLMWGAPKFLPYALLFNPGILPAPFQAGAAAAAPGAEGVWAAQSRRRSAAVLRALLDLEQASRDMLGPGFSFAKLNILGKEERAKRQQQLVAMTSVCSDLMRDATMSGRTGAERALDSLPQGWLYRKPVVPGVNDGQVDFAASAAAPDTAVTDVSDFSRGERRLVHVPKPVIQGLTHVLNGGSGGFFANLQPHFLTRGRFLGHIEKVEQADDFLVAGQIDLETISKKLLREACSDRFFDNPRATEEELRQQLADWLDLTVHEPAMKLKNKEALYHNGRLARMALMAYNCLESTRSPSSASTLPRLLYSGTPPSNEEDSDKHGLGFLKR